MPLPTNLQPIPTRLDVILQATQAQLVASLGWPAERVLVVPPEKLTIHPQADAYLWMWPDTESPDRPIWQGAGSLDTRMTERLQVGVRTRTAVDEAPSAYQWLTDSAQGLGHLANRHKVYKAFLAEAGFIPADADGNALTAGPFGPGQGGKPRLTPEDLTVWGESVLGFDFIYILNFA